MIDDPAVVVRDDRSHSIRISQIEVVFVASQPYRPQTQ